MTRAICSTAAAAALVVMSMGAQAADVTLDFETLATDVAGPGNGGVGVPIPVGTTQPGFVFSGAYGYNAKTIGSDDPGNDVTPTPATRDGYIANALGNGIPTNIELSLTGANAGRIFKTVSFDLFVSATTPIFELWDDAGLVRAFTVTPSSGNKVWSGSGDREMTDISGQYRGNRLKFGALNDGLLGLDNLRIDFVAGTPPNPVPEPASYGLVALALLGAGLATRRRKA